MIGEGREGHPSKGRKACCYWRSDADGIATWGLDQQGREDAPVAGLRRRGHPPTASDLNGQDCAVSMKLCAGEPSQVRWVSCVLFVAALAAVRHLALCRAVKW